MRSFFLIWQDPETRRWLPVGKLDQIQGHFVFGYTAGALVSSRFVPFGNLTAIRSVYVAETLFPIFANRVLSARRPEYRTYARWSGMDDILSPDPLLLMARMGGSRATDALQVYPVPQRTSSGDYYSAFFCHGLSHLPDETQARSLKLIEGQRLFPMFDVQNPFDENAVALRTADPACMIGYLPRHVAPDIKALVQKSATLNVSVRRVNLDAPPQYRVLCEAVSSWPAGFAPCSGGEYRTLTDYDPAALLDRVLASGSRHSAAS